MQILIAKAILVAISVSSLNNFYYEIDQLQFYHQPPKQVKHKRFFLFSFRHFKLNVRSSCNNQL